MARDKPEALKGAVWDEVDKVMASNPLLDVAQKTIRDAVAETLQGLGISEAVGFEITLKNGGTHQILSTENPLLNSPASDIAVDAAGRPRVSVKQSAQAGAGLIQVFKLV